MKKFLIKILKIIKPLMLKRQKSYPKEEQERFLFSAFRADRKTLF